MLVFNAVLPEDQCLFSACYVQSFNDILDYSYMLEIYKYKCFRKFIATVC